MTTKKKKNTAIASAEAVIAVKGFDQTWSCRGYQYELGKTFTHEGKVEACSTGFHSVEYPLDVFTYYPPASSRFAIVEASGELSRHGDDTKIASATITLKAELHLPELIQRAVDWVMARVTYAEGSHNTVDKMVVTNSGVRGASTNTGLHGVAADFGWKGKARSSEGGAIACVYRNDEGELLRIRASKVGDNGVKADTWYSLDATGEFIEVVE